MNCLLVPTLALDVSLLERLSNSIDYPVKHKIVVNNGKEDALDDWHSRHRDWSIVSYGHNLGCAGSWNVAANYIENESVLILNSDFVDENFYPIYFEDYDYRIRMRLLGLEPYIVGLRDSDIQHGKGKPGGERYNSMINKCGVLNRDYMLRKWGTLDDNKINFTHPFDNKHDNHIWYWELEKRRRQELLAIWNEFINDENPSIYT